MPGRSRRAATLSWDGFDGNGYPVFFLSRNAMNSSAGARPRLPGFGLCLALLSTVSQADGIATPVEEHVVTAAHLAPHGQPLPYRITEIGGDTLTRRQARTLPEAVGETPGVMVQKTAHGQGSPYIRGFTGYRTLALVDGIRYNNSVYRDGPSEYFSLIDVQSLERLEVLNGPASVRYGSDAVGGVISAQTERSAYGSRQTGTHFLQGSQHYRYGSADQSHLSRTELDLGAGQQWGLRVGYSYKDYGDVHAADLGRLPRTGYGEQAVDARLDVALTDNWRVTALHQRLRQDDVWRTHATVFSRPFKGTTPGTDRLRLKDQARTLSYVRLQGSGITTLIDSARLTLSHQQWAEEGERIRDNGGALLENFKSNMSGIDLELSSHLAALGLRYGIDYYRDNVDSHGAQLGADGQLIGINIQGPVGDDAFSGSLGAYVQGELPLGERLAIIAGTRYTHIDVDIGVFEDPLTGAPAAFDDQWQQLVHSLRAAYVLQSDGRQQVWAGVSQAFRAPNLADLSRFGASRSNETEIAATGLTPEQFLSFELGWRGQWAPLSISVSTFRTRIHDYIASTPTGRRVDGNIEVSKRNSASGYVQGIELAAQVDFSAQWRMRANLSWQEGRLDTFASLDASVSSRENLSRVMPLTAHWRLDWSSADQRSWWSGVVTLSDSARRLSSADRLDSERIPPGGTPGYVLLGLHAGHALSSHITLTAALDNILDDAYRVHGSGSNEAGLGATVGMTVTF